MNSVTGQKWKFVNGQICDVQSGQPIARATNPVACFELIGYANEMSVAVESESVTLTPVEWRVMREDAEKWRQLCDDVAAGRKLVTDVPVVEREGGAP